MNREAIFKDRPTRKPTLISKYTYGRPLNFSRAKVLPSAYRETRSNFHLLSQAFGLKKKNTHTRKAYYYETCQKGSTLYIGSDRVLIKPRTITRRRASLRAKKELIDFTQRRNNDTECKHYGYLTASALLKIATDVTIKNVVPANYENS